MNVRDVPLPDRMKHLPRDKRGYPVPWIVVIDSAGTPHFVLNDRIKMLRAYAQDLCGICGERIIGFRWFAGGPASAFHENGAYNDPPMHHECLHYALRVCPYLAARSFGDIDHTKVISRVSDKEQRTFIDLTMMPGRPDVFVVIKSKKSVVYVSDDRSSATIAPLRPYREIEVWRHGTQLTYDHALALIPAEWRGALAAHRSRFQCGRETTQTRPGR